MNAETSAFRLTLYLSTTICYARNIPITRDSEINHKGANVHGTETWEGVHIVLVSSGSQSWSS